MNDDEAVQPRVYEALVDELHTRSRASFIGLALVLVLLRGLLDDVCHKSPLDWIFGAMGVVLAIRVLLVLRAQRKQGFFASPQNRHLVFGIGSTTTALLFSAMNVVAYRHMDAVQLATLAVCATGINAIALVNMGSSPVLYHLYMLPNLLPMIVLTAIGPKGSGLRLLPVLIVLYVTVLSMMALHEHRSRRDNIALRFQVAEMALVDSLTQLRNRRYLHEFMSGEVEQVLRGWAPNEQRASHKRRLLLMMVDLDHFKAVNDTYGHEAGDALLRQLADVLRATVRKQDVVARWGGEEFVVVAREGADVDGCAVAERIRAAVEAHDFQLPDGKVLRKTCSIGYAPYPFWIDSPAALRWDDVLGVADAGLYRAKQLGRNRVIGIVGHAPDGEALELVKHDVDRASERGLVRVVA